MIKIEDVEVMGMRKALKGMRNSMNSWDKSDSYYTCEYDFNKYKKLKIQVSSTPGSGTLTILNGSNNNVLTQNIYSSREYSIDIKNLNAVYSLKFESSGKDGFNIRKIYLEG